MQEIIHTCRIIYTKEMYLTSKHQDIFLTLNQYLLQNTADVTTWVVTSAQHDAIKTNTQDWLVNCCPRPYYK